MWLRSGIFQETISATIGFSTRARDIAAVQQESVSANTDSDPSIEDVCNKTYVVRAGRAMGAFRGDVHKERRTGGATPGASLSFFDAV